MRWAVFSARSALVLVLAALAAAGIGGGVAAQMENHDAFCASCHTEPESTYVTRSRAAQPVDLASFHARRGVRCIDCHSGPGVSGRVKAMMLGAHDALRFLSGRYPQPAPLTRPIRDDHCVKCHADVLHQRTFDRHFHVFLPQWQALDARAGHCVDCHQGHNTQGEARLSFLNREVTLQVCRACHAFAGEGE